MATVIDKRENARSLVGDIVRSHGGLGEEVLVQMAPEIRHQVEQALRIKDEMSASSILT
jgi:hypothetical protein